MGLTNQIKSFKARLATVILILVILRLGVLVVSQNNDIVYLIRQIISTVAYMGVALFMIYCSLDFYQKYEKKKITNMKHAAFWAMIACVARLASSAVYYWPLISDNILMSAHNVAELATWTLLAVFFGLYWRIRANQEDDEDYTY